MLAPSSNLLLTWTAFKGTMFKETVVDCKDEKYLLLFKMGKD